MSTTWKRIQFALDRNLREAMVVHDHLVEKELAQWESWLSESMNDPADGENPEDELYLPSSRQIQRQIKQQERKEMEETSAYLSELHLTGRVRNNTHAVTPLLVQRIENASIMADAIYELEGILGEPSAGFPQAMQELTITLWEKAGRKCHVAQWASDPDTSPNAPKKTLKNKNGASWHQIAEACHEFETALYETLTDIDDGDPEEIEREDLRPSKEFHSESEIALAYFVQNAEDGMPARQCAPNLKMLELETLRHLFVRMDGLSNIVSGICHLTHIFQNQAHQPPVGFVKYLVDDHWNTQRRPRLETLLREAKKNG